MTLTIRRIVVLGIIGTILLLGNILFVASWLAEKGVVGWAHCVRAEYLTGTVVTIIVVLLILLVSLKAKAVGCLRRCPVCDKVLVNRGAHYAKGGASKTL